MSEFATTAEASFAAAHPVGFCKVPGNLESLPHLAASRQFMAPSRIDLRDLCCPTKDQGSKPWCAAYSAASFAENILWRVRDFIEEFDPTWIYSWAKAHDGSPTTDGTTLVAVLEALRGKVFNEVCQVKVIRKSRLSFKYAIHKFGCCLGAFDIDSSWWGVKRDTPVITGNGQPNCGGHAVLCVGYSRDGVWIQNSWGSGYGTSTNGWGEYGFAMIPWDVWDREWLYGAVLSNCLDNLTLNA